MRRAHGVQVVLLHQQYIFDHRLVGDALAQVGMMVMAVGALHLDRPAVDQENAVFDFDRTEADSLRHGLDDAAIGALKRGDQGVEIGRFRVPEQRTLNLRSQLTRGRSGGSDRCDRCTSCIQQGDLYRMVVGCGACDLNGDLQPGVRVVLVECGPHADIVDVG